MFSADGTLNNLGQAAGHLAVGCLSGSIANASCGGGAAGAVTAEFAAEYAHSYLGYSATDAATIGKYTAAMAGVLVQDGADGVTAAYQAGTTAVENNYLAPHEKEEVAALLKAKENCIGEECTVIDIKIDTLQQTSDQRDRDFKNYLSECAQGSKFACAQAKAIHYDLRQEWTGEGNAYYLAHQKEFELLPDEQAIWHTYVTDPNTGEVINIASEGADYRKYIHPTLGYEVVVDNLGKIIANPLNAGTYNFYNPTIEGVNNLDILLMSNGFHEDFDVDPYFDFGNAPPSVDPTTELQRYGRILFWAKTKIGDK